MRLVAPTLERPVAGETARDARQRRERNRLARQAWHTAASARCAVCGLANINVRHNVDVADQFEGPEYYADIRDLHEFVP